MKYLPKTNRHSLYVLFMLLLSGAACSYQSSEPVTKAEIRQTEEGFRIFLDGEPMYIKGAGVGTGVDPVRLAGHGANAVRTWSVNRGKEVLDKAHENNMKVMMGIWLVSERLGFDYDDTVAVQKQLEETRKKVEQFKDHPALIIWGIGNELNHHASSPKVWDAVNEISQMIHEIDPNHLTTTTLAGINKETAGYLQARAPDLDFICAQLYAPIDRLPEIVAASEYTGPLLITEWGATGYWEVPKTAWGAPIENNSSVKADLYLSRYQNSILSQPEQVMGSFVFLWGQKQERTPTWFGILMPDGSETESVDVMHYGWKVNWPSNRTPRLHDFTLDGRRAIDNITLTAGDTFAARVRLSDPEGDALTYRWEVMEESRSNKTGGDKEVIPPVIEGLFLAGSDSIATFTAPADTGAYRLFVYVDDGNRHTAHANIPFLVQ